MLLLTLGELPLSRAVLNAKVPYYMIYVRNTYIGHTKVLKFMWVWEQEKNNSSWALKQSKWIPYVEVNNSAMTWENSKTNWVFLEASVQGIMPLGIIILAADRKQEEVGCD